MTKKSDLPFGSEFSPSQLDLPGLLEIIDRNQGDPKALEGEILATYFAEHGTSGNDEVDEKNRETLAYNSRLSVRHYGITDQSANFTDFGRSLFDLRDDETKLYPDLAKHILLNLNGMRLVQCIQDMTAAGEDISLQSLRAALKARGIHLPSGNKHLSSMRLWLAKAGIIVGGRWQVDDLRLREVLGTGSTEFEELSGLTPEQRAFLRALINTSTTTPQPANAIAKLASATYGVKFPEKSLPKLILNDLRDAGWITADKTTEGRGSKPFLVAPTPKLIAEIVEPLLAQLSEQIDPKLMALLRLPLAAILIDLQSEDRNVSGLALEALAFKLMRLLDVSYVATRLRNTTTGGAEIDLIFDSTRLVFSRWQVQCKNTADVSLDDVAKEVGLTQFLKTNAIIVITTGKISSQARRFSNKTVADTNLAIVMIEGPDLARIEENPAAIIDVFQREAHNAMKLKALDVGAL